MAEKKIPINLQDAVVLAEVSETTWREVLNSANEPGRLTGEVVTYDRLRSSFQADHPGDELFDAIETIFELGTDTGRDLILQAADDQQVTLDQLADVPAREFSARIWIQSRSSIPLKAVLARARINVFEIGQNRTYREFAQKNGDRLPAFDKDKMKVEIAKWYEENQETNAVNIFPYERDGEWYCEIIKGDPRKRVVEVRNNNLSLLEFQPAASDLVRYDPNTGRIGIATRSPRLLQMYRVLLGKLLANDEQLFTNENICSLKELQKHERALFERHFSGILRVDVVELLWRRGDRDKVLVRGRDCFRILSDLGAHLREGELIEAKLTITFAGASRLGHVSLKVPNRIDIKAGTHEAAVERMLDEVGIRGSFDDEDGQHNFWSRYPWRMSEAEYRRYFRNDFDRLLRRNIVRRVNFESVTHPDHPAAKGTLRVVNVDAYTTFGSSDDPAIASRTLTPSDIAGYELDFEKLAKDVAATLGLEGNCREITTGLWSLGYRSLTSTVAISVFLATREVPDTTLSIMRGTSLGTTPVLLVPKCCASLLDIPNVPCTLPGGPHDSLLGGIVRLLQLENQVEPPVYLRDELIIHLGRGLVWFRGIPLNELKINTHAFKLAVALAQAQGRIVSKQTINEALSESRNDDEVAKKAKAALVKAIKDSFTTAGIADAPNANEIVASRGGGYALQTTVRILS